MKILAGSTSTSDNVAEGKILSQDFIGKMFQYESKYQHYQLQNLVILLIKQEVQKNNKLNE